MTMIFPAEKMSIADAGITAVFGYIVVFAGLLILMVLLYVMAANVPAAVKAVSAPTAPGSAGHIKLFDVPDKEAAMVMAVVAYNMQRPLNELHFISIKEVKSDEV